MSVNVNCNRASNVSKAKQKFDKDNPPDWSAESELDTSREKFKLKRRYWKAVHNLGKTAVETSGKEVLERRKENKALIREWKEVENEEKLKDIIFPTWKRSSYTYRKTSLNKNVDTMDDTVLNIKKQHGKLVWSRKKKEAQCEKMEVEYNHLKEFEERSNREMAKDDTMKKIKRFNTEIGLKAAQTDHAQTVHRHYKKLIVIVRKGNVEMSKKLDYLECAAERVHREKWELYQIKTMAEYLKKDAEEQQENRRNEVIRNRQRYDKNTSSVKEEIQRQALSDSLLARIQGLDDQEKELANKALKMLGKGMKQTIVDRAKGPDAQRGPRLRRIAFKIIRMKYEENMNSKMEQALKQFADLQACSAAETMDGILAAFKEQKDTTLYLRNVSGMLETRWMQMVKQREDFRLQFDALAANLSHEIDSFDEKGKEKHKLLHNQIKRKEDVNYVMHESGALVARISSTMKSILNDLLTFKAKPKVGELKKNSLELDTKKKPKLSQDSATYLRHSLEITGNPSELIEPILEEMENLMTFINEMKPHRRAAVQDRTKQYHPVFQTFLENAIYGSAHITRTSSEVSTRSISDKRGSFGGESSDRDSGRVLNREEMKELSEDTVIAYKNKFKTAEAEETRAKGNYHKYC